MLGEIDPFMPAGLEFARRWVSRRGLEAVGGRNAERLEIEIEQRVFAIPPRRMLLGRDDAPPPLRVDQLRQLEREVRCPMACGVFHIRPIRRPSSAVLTPPI